MSTTTPPTDRATITLHDDGTGEVVVDGVAEPIAAPDVATARSEAIEVVTRVAARSGRPVAFTAVDRGQAVRLLAHPDGGVSPLDGGAASSLRPSALAPTAPAVFSAAPRPRRAALVVTSIVAVVALAGCAVLAVTGKQAVDDARADATTAHAQSSQVAADLTAQLADAQKKVDDATAARKKAESAAVAAQKKADDAVAARKSAEAARKKAEAARKKAEHALAQADKKSAKATSEEKK
jgi:hypothetical protein